MISHDRIGVVEVMGNKCGDIALYSALAAGANFLILPEAPFDLDEICSELVKARLKGRFSSMIVVSEGAAHAADVAKYIGEKTGFDTKSVVLGYTQRGGNPSQSDRILASRLAEQAVRLLYKGVSNRTCLLYTSTFYPFPQGLSAIPRASWRSWIYRDSPWIVI